MSTAIAESEVIVEKCWCGHVGCSDYWLRGYGKFVQGSGFSYDEATNIANLLNQQARDKHTRDVQERQA